jgi:hypothetical protein
MPVTTGGWVCRLHVFWGLSCMLEAACICVWQNRWHHSSHGVDSCISLPMLLTRLIAHQSDAGPAAHRS